MSSAKFDALAAKVGSSRIAGWITQHNPKVKARADKTRGRHRLAKVGNKLAGKSTKDY